MRSMEQEARMKDGAFCSQAMSLSPIPYSLLRRSKGANRG